MKSILAVASFVPVLASAQVFDYTIDATAGFTGFELDRHPATYTGKLTINPGNGTAVVASTLASVPFVLTSSFERTVEVFSFPQGPAVYHQRVDYTWTV